MTIDWSAVQSANTFGAGPASGSPAVPTMRAIVYADLDASVRAALLAEIICNIGQAFPQWLEFALVPFKVGSATVLTAGTWTDRPPGFEFVTGFLPRASRISGTGLVTIDIKFGSTGGGGGTSIFSTKLTIDDGELTSTTAATPCVLSTSTHTDDAEMSIIVEGAGTDTAGLTVRLPVYWTGF
jgi:hypothetical protein